MFERALMGEEEAFNFWGPTAVLTIVTFLVSLSIAFEKGKEYILETLNEKLHPVLDTMFGEMTLLGFIGLVFFFINKLELLNGPSERYFGEEETLNELFETVHMILFLVMMIFLVQILLQLKYASELGSEWEECEKKLFAMRANKKHISDYEEENLHEYYHLREQFVSTLPAKTEKDIQDAEDFDFAQYLILMISEDLAELVEVPPTAWAVLWVIFAVYTGYDLLIGGDSMLLMASVFGGYLLLAFFFVTFRNKLTNVATQLMPASRKATAKKSTKKPSENSNLLAGSAAAKEYNSITPEKNLHVPPYHDIEIPKHDSSASDDHMKHIKKHFKLATSEILLHKQLSLFWHNDPEFLLTSMQVFTLTSAVLIAVTGVLLSSESISLTFTTRIVMVVLAMVLTTVYLLQYPSILEHSTVARHLEQFKNISAITEVKHITSAKKTLAALSMLAMMRTKFAKEDSTKTARDIWPEDEEYKEKEHEVHELFKMFDDDGSDEVDYKEFALLLKDVANMSDAEETARVFKELDQDGAGTVDFAEFFNWYARRVAMATADPRVLIKTVFEIVDDDGNGHLTVEELLDVFKDLGQTVSAADIQWLIKEVDENGNGEIEEEEFAELFEKYVLE